MLGDTGFHLGAGLYHGFDGHYHGQWRGRCTWKVNISPTVPRPSAARLNPFRDCLIELRDPQTAAVGIGNCQTWVQGCWPELGLPTAECSDRARPRQTGDDMNHAAPSAADAPPAAPAKLPFSTHWTLLLLLFVYTMSFTDRQIIGILMQPIKTEFGVSDTAMGLLSGLAFALFYSALGVPMARYADRANRRNFVAYCCGAPERDDGAVRDGRGLLDIGAGARGVAGEAGGTPPSLSMVADHYPKGQARPRDEASTCSGRSSASSSDWRWAAGSRTTCWRQAFIWMAIPGIVAAVLLRFTGVEPRRGAWEARNRRPARVRPAESFGAVMRDLWQSKAFVRASPWPG